MAQGSEVTVAGQRYANAAAHIRAVLGTLRTAATQHGAEPVEVTVEPDGELGSEEIADLA